jgi:hypothetical protein
MELCRCLRFKQSPIYRLELALKRKGKERPMLVEKRVVILSIAGGNGIQTVAVNGPGVGILAIVFANPVRKSLMEVEPRQI